MTIGQSVPRVDSRPKVTGAAQYGSDRYPPGCFSAKVLTSPYAHARILRVDTSEAKKVGGVRGIITFADVRKVLHAGFLPPPGGPQDHYILADKARYVGDLVAAVAADDEYSASEALEKIHVEYEKLPAVFDPVEAMNPGAPRIHEDAEGKYIHDASRNIACYDKSEYGDVDRALRESYLVVGPTRYTTAAIHTWFLERSICIAEYDSYDHLKVWVSTQNPFIKRVWLSTVLGIPVSKITVSTPYIGGSYGAKVDLFRHEALCCMLAMMTRRPVRIELSREESMVKDGGGIRHPSVVDLTIGVNRDGTFTALKADIVAGAGAYCPHGPGIIGNMVHTFYSLYRFPNYRAEAYMVYTNTPFTGAFRGYGVTKSTFVLESHVDRLATELHVDPIELRLKNAVHLGDTIPWSGTVIRTCGLEECIKKGADAIGWHRRSDPSFRGYGPTRRGIGMAALTHHTGMGGEGQSPLPRKSEMEHDYANAFVRGNEDGTFTIRIGVPEIGAGQHTALAQIGAEALGIPYTSVIMEPLVDTDSAAYDFGPAADRVTYVCGGAVKAAAEDAKAQMLQAAGRMLDARPDDLEIVGGEVRVRGAPQNSFPIGRVVSKAQMDGGMIFGRGHYIPKANAPTFGAEFAEVEVDIRTGKALVKRFVGAFDIGRAINPLMAESQMEGAIAQGLGAALMEEIVIDPESGQPLNANLADYRLPSTLDMPEVKVIIVETMDPTGPFGAKGCGQMPLEGVAPAIRNAICHAIGAWVNDIPTTGERILKAARASTK